MDFRRLPVLLAAAAVLAGCRSHATPPPASNVTSAPTTSPEARDRAFRAAATQLSKDVNAPRDSIAGVSQDEVTWRDSCLGCPKAGERCAQVLTPGYRVVLRIADATYEYHTDLGGKARLCGQNSSPSETVAPPPAPTPGR